MTHLIAAADPLPDSDLTLDVTQGWARLEAKLEAEPDAVVVPLRRRHRRYAVTGAIAAAVALTAAAPFIVTRTGVWNTPEWVPAGGAGENYRLDGTDFPSELARLAADIPFPDDAARQASLAAIVANAAALRSSEAATGALRAEIARGAICTWTMTWKDADATGRVAAVTALRGALTWPAVTDVDPKPAIDGYRADSGTAPTVFGYLPGVIDAAASGDSERLDALVDESGYCAVLTRPSRGEIAGTDWIAGPGAESHPTTKP